MSISRSRLRRGPAKAVAAKAAPVNKVEVRMILLIVRESFGVVFAMITDTESEIIEILRTHINLSSPDTYVEFLCYCFDLS